MATSTTRRPTVLTISIRLAPRLKHALDAEAARQRISRERLLRSLIAKATSVKDTRPTKAPQWLRSTRHAA